MSVRDIDKAYISPYDRFLYDFDNTHKKSPSQQAEIDKHKRIAELRDNVVPEQDQTILWEDF